MDPLSDMLSGIRSAGASVSQASLDPPWTIRFTGGAPLTMLTVISGGGSLVLPDGTGLRIGAGDTALVRGPDPFHLADDPASLRRPHRNQEIACLEPDPGYGPDGGPPGGLPRHGGLRDSGFRGGGLRDEGLRNGGPSFAGLPNGGLPDQVPPGVTTLIVAAYRATRSRHERLLRTLPPTLVLTEEQPENVFWLDAAKDALSRRHLPGGQALVDRVVDMGLVCSLACWFEQEGADAPAWYRGALDPVTGPALEAVHRRPHEAWTVGALAARAGVSRALFAKRFTEVMGQSPLGYLTEWRMYTAEELLSDPDLSVAKVAGAVGYADPSSFSTAFKRLRGLSPREFRLRSMLSEPGPAPVPGTGSSHGP
ncbi:AraC family transcriptional regulator [Nocardiopsis deserti]|uniref:AraC family transcriptional regulator n=1 Tax=Nocardiopsis deserti TaxID=2605988 RepID=UPI001CC26C34|nr:AraC family transcriptional regulator [Nocardiopsis deserti]